MGQSGQPDMENTDQTPDLVGPTQAVAKLKQQEAEAGDDGQVVPDLEIEVGDLKNESAQEYSGNTNVGCPQHDVENSHPGGAAIFINSVAGGYFHGELVL